MPVIGLIGCGGITATHLRAYKDAGYNVVALCDAAEERAEARRKEYFPRALVFTDHRKLLRRDDIDVVDVATHPEERLAIIRDAMKAGKHVLSQKPFVLDLDAGRRLCDLADAKGVKLAVNQNGRWAPHFSYIRHAISAGLIGDVTAAHLAVSWDHNWCAGTPFDKVHHLVLYDFAIHWFDILTQFMGGRRAKRVFASTARAANQRTKPPLLAQVLVEYEGAQATLSFDASTGIGPRDGTFIVGTQGTIGSTGPDLAHQTVTLTTAAGSASPRLSGTWFPGGFHGTMGELLCAVEDKRQPSNNARDNLRSLALCFAAARSADTGKPQIPGRVRRVEI